MSNIFDIKRFGNYLVYDLKNLWNRFGWSLIIYVSVPLIVYLFTVLAGFLFGKSYVTPDISVRIGVFVAILIAVCMTYPAKIYGKVTDKKEGAMWTLLPASNLEKCISMLIICLVIVPILFLTGFFTVDFLVSYLDPSMSGSVYESIRDFIVDSDAINVSGFFIVYINIVTMSLCFLLGALILRSKKIGGVILAWIILSTILSLLIMMVIGNNSEEIKDFFLRLAMNDADKLGLIVNIMINTYYFVLIAGFSVAAYFRIKTIKY